MKLTRITALAWAAASVVAVGAENVAIQTTTVVGDGIVEYVPVGFDQEKTPSLILKEEPVATGEAMPANWELTPVYTVENGKASVSLKLTGDISLYGGGEVTGPLLRNGQYVKMWNTDNGAYYSYDDGKRLYQTHPWVLGVRRDGSAFGIIFDTTWKAELYTNSDEVIYNTEGALFRTYIIERETPQDVLKGLAELTGTIQMPPRWTLGWHQCRFSYAPDSRVREVADTFREKNIPCDVIWMDIDYMRGYRVFTFDPNGFPDPRALNDDLHKKGFRAVYMIDPGVKYEPNAGYSIFDSGMENDVWLKTPDDPQYGTSEYIIGDAWPGAVLFPDFTMPHVQEWWAGLYKDFLAMGMDGVWNDVNEPQVNCIHTNPNNLNEKLDLQGDENRTLPYSTPHRGGGDLPAGSHLMYHNAYGRLMVEASLKGIMAERPDQRPFLLTRSNLLGGQRFAATWTGDNYAAEDQMRLSVPMSITLGLSGQPFNGPDIGGFLGNTSGDLFANWIGFGVFMPFARGHACAGTNDKEPWAFGEDIEKTARMAIERRYRLIPYLYTLYYEASQSGLPIMQPVFFDDLTDLRLRDEQQAFLMGKDLLVVPAFAQNPMLPTGIWEDLSLIEGDKLDKYQAKLKVKGGSIIPAGRVVQNTNENSFEPLTLIVCLDEEGKAEGQLYMDAGDGWAFKCGDYGMLTFTAERDGDTVRVRLASKEGDRKVEKEIKRVEAEVLLDGKVYKAQGSLKGGVKVSLK